MKKISVIIILFSLMLVSCSLTNQKKELVLANDLGMEFMEEGKYKDALSKFEEALKYEEENDIILNNISWAYYNLEDYDNALLYAEKALELGDDSEEKLINYGNVLFELGDYDDSIRNYKIALEHNAESVFANYGIGLSNYELKNYKVAIKYFTKVISIKPNDISSLEYRALSMIYSEEYENAISEILDFFGEGTVGYHMNFLIEVFNQTSDYQRAIEVMNIVNSKYSGIEIVDFNYAKVHSQNGDYEKSILLFEDYIIKYPNDVFGYIWIIDAAKNLNQYELALEYAKKMIEIDSTSYNVNSSLADLYYSKQDYFEATKYYEVLLDLTDEKEVVYLQFLDALWMDDNYENGILIGEKATLEFPDNEYILEYLALFYSDSGNSIKAIELFDIALRINPKYEDLYSDKAWELLILQKYDDAFDVISEGLKLNPDNQIFKDLLNRINENR